MKGSPSGLFVVSEAKTLRVVMRTSKVDRVEFRVNQAIGSMAIEGIHVSKSTRAEMLRIVSGEVSAESVIKRYVKKHRQQPAT